MGKSKIIFFAFQLTQIMKISNPFDLFAIIQEIAIPFNHGEFS